MKASELIAYLQEQMIKKGDQEVILHGAYGASGNVEPMPDEKLPSYDYRYINLCTDLMTG